MATECSNRGHSAAFPVDLPTWFIKLFTDSGDMVLDPFIGSGTTAVAAKQMGRKYVGIDIDEEYCHIARERLMRIQPQLLEPAATYTTRSVQ
jgi:DNA modification methylase